MPFDTFATTSTATGHLFETSAFVIVEDRESQCRARLIRGLELARDAVLEASAPGHSLCDLKDALNSLHQALDRLTTYCAIQLDEEVIGVHLSALPSYLPDELDDRTELPIDVYSADPWFFLVRDDDVDAEGPWKLVSRELFA